VPEFLAIALRREGSAWQADSSSSAEIRRRVTVFERDLPFSGDSKVSVSEELCVLDLYLSCGDEGCPSSSTGRDDLRVLDFDLVVFVVPPLRSTHGDEGCPPNSTGRDSLRVLDFDRVVCDVPPSRSMISSVLEDRRGFEEDCVCDVLS
jgi:hypothetical protein